MLILPINLIVLIFQLVLSMKCPFCANFKSECDKKENVHSMDCEKLEIEGKSAVSYWKEPSDDKPDKFFEDIKKYKDEEGYTMTCLAVDYHFIKNNVSTHKPQNDPNATTPEPIDLSIFHFDRKYVLKMCTLNNKKHQACETWTQAEKVTDQPMMIKIDKCETKNSARLSVVSSRLIVFIASMVLLKMFV